MQIDETSVATKRRRRGPAMVNAPEDTGVHGPRLYVTADPLSTPLQNWTKVDLARHHDESAAGQWWAGKWQFFATSSGAPQVAGLCAGGTADGELQFSLSWQGKAFAG